MRRLVLLVALLLPAPALAAWTDTAQNLIDAADGSAVSSILMNTLNALSVGDVAVCAVGTDETGTGTTDGDNNQHTTIVDGSSNTWVQAAEFQNMQTSTAADGASVSIYYARITSALASGGNITFNFSAATTRKAFACWRFSVAAGSTVSLAAGASTLANDAADPGSMTVATGVSQSHLFVRASACETNSPTWTPTATYSAFTNFGSQSNSGTAATSIALGVEYKIETAATSTASNPTLATVDCASVMVGLDEVAAAGGSAGLWGGWF